jgi:hypothetical protein
MGRSVQLITAERVGFPRDRIRTGDRCSLDAVLEPVSVIVSECFPLISS